jgi:hypothetical protein
MYCIKLRSYWFPYSYAFQFTGHKTLVHKPNFKDSYRIIRGGKTSKMLRSKVNTLKKIMRKYQGGNTEQNYFSLYHIYIHDVTPWWLIIMHRRLNLKNWTSNVGRNVEHVLSWQIISVCGFKINCYEICSWKFQKNSKEVALYSTLLFPVSRSTCFGHIPCPSSGAQLTVLTASGVDKQCVSSCHRGWVRTMHGMISIKWSWK